MTKRRNMGVEWLLGGYHLNAGSNWIMILDSYHGTNLSWCNKFLLPLFFFLLLVLLLRPCCHKWNPTQRVWVPCRCSEPMKVQSDAAIGVLPTLTRRQDCIPRFLSVTQYVSRNRDLGEKTVGRGEVTADKHYLVQLHVVRISPSGMILPVLLFTYLISTYLPTYLHYLGFLTEPRNGFPPGHWPPVLSVRYVWVVVGCSDAFRRATQSGKMEQ